MPGPIAITSLEWQARAQQQFHHRPWLLEEEDGSVADLVDFLRQYHMEPWVKQHSTQTTSGFVVTERLAARPTLAWFLAGNS